MRTFLITEQWKAYYSQSIYPTIHNHHDKVDGEAKETPGPDPKLLSFPSLGRVCKRSRLLNRRSFGCTVRTMMASHTGTLIMIASNGRGQDKTKSGGTSAYSCRQPQTRCGVRITTTRSRAQFRQETPNETPHESCRREDDGRKQSM